MGKQLNCPNCGAPITGSVCDYCGSVFLDFGAIELFKPLWLRVKLKGQLVCLRVIPNRFSVDTDMTEYNLYADDRIALHECRFDGFDISLGFHTVEDPEGWHAVIMPEDNATVDPIDLAMSAMK